jgi:hypothetical protein
MWLNRQAQLCGLDENFVRRPSQATSKFTCRSVPVDSKAELVFSAGVQGFRWFGGFVIPCLFVLKPATSPKQVTARIPDTRSVLALTVSVLPAAGGSTQDLGVPGDRTAKADKGPFWVGSRRYRQNSPSWDDGRRQPGRHLTDHATDMFVRLLAASSRPPERRRAHGNSNRPARADHPTIRVCGDPVGRDLRS